MNSNRLLWGLGLCAALSGCVPKKNAPDPKLATPPVQPAKDPKAGGKTQALRVVQDGPGGQRLWTVETKSAEQSQLKKNAVLRDSTVTLYEKGKPDLVIVAPETRIEGSTKDLIMGGGIVARAPQEKTVFRVDSMRWNAGTKQFIGTGNVRYTRDTATMTAARLRGVTPLKRVVFDGGVSMVVEGAKR
jgi:hypothetical protein